MNAIQPQQVAASNEAAQQHSTHTKIEALEFEGLNVEVLAIEKTDRWSIYRRLQELDIPCNCNIEKPLEAQIATPTAALQLWSIARYYRSSREQLLDFLDDCWQTRFYS
ncbi:MAG: Asr1405/Asl0597 family protein [Cyanobacteria bacterium P01_E01_bin.42]